jgi:hypothetical protein
VGSEVIEAVLGLGLLSAAMTVYDVLVTHGRRAQKLYHDCKNNDLGQEEVPSILPGFTETGVGGRVSFSSSGRLDGAKLPEPGKAVR